MSPIVVWDENEALRGSMSRTIPAAARIMPAILIHVSFSNPAMDPTVKAKTGIITANREVFEAVVSHKPEMKKS